jgi:hypothetical protein
LGLSLSARVNVVAAVDWREFSTAVHEAAHAVLGVAFGVAISRLSLAGTRDLSGAQGSVVESAAPLSRDEADELCRLRNRGGPSITEEPPSSIGPRVCMLLAGGIAERVVDPAGEGDWHDRFEAEQMAAHALRVPPWSEPVRRLIACCSRLVRVQVGLHWLAIERVAIALLEHGTVTGDDVRRLMRDAR